MHQNMQSGKYISVILETTNREMQKKKKNLVNSSSNILGIGSSHGLDPYGMVAAKCDISNHNSTSLPSHRLMQ